MKLKTKVGLCCLMSLGILYIISEAAVIYIAAANIHLEQECVVLFAPY